MKKKILLMSPAVFVILAFAVVPLFIMLYVSFLSDGQVPHLTFDNYVKFFAKSFYLGLTWKTIKMSLTVTIICIVLAYPMAYIMAKVIERGKNLLLLLIIIPFWTSQLVRAYSWMNLLREGGILEIFLKKIYIIGSGDNLGLLFTHAAYIIALVHIFFPYMVIAIFMSLEKLDNSLLEASTSLGASRFETFKKIILPLSKPGIITGCILVFVPCLGAFVEPRILGGINGSVIGTIIEDQFFEIYGWNFGAAIAFILLAMVLSAVGILSELNKEA